IFSLSFADEYIFQPRPLRIHQSSSATPLFTSLQPFHQRSSATPATMFFRIEIEPKIQFLTAVVGVDGLPYFLLRDIRNLLRVRNGSNFSNPRLDRAASPLLRVRDVLPAGDCFHFKYERYYAVSEQTLQHSIMDLYVSQLDPTLHQWFRDIWIERGVKPVSRERYQKALEHPYITGFPAKMTRFVVDPVNTQHLKTDYLPSLVNSTLLYYKELERQRDQQVMLQSAEQTPRQGDVQQQQQQQPEDVKFSAEQREQGLRFIDGLFSQLQSANTQSCSEGRLQRQEVAAHEPIVQIHEEQTTMDCDSTRDAYDGGVVVEGYLGDKRTFLGFHRGVPDVLVAYHRQRCVTYRPEVMQPQQQQSPQTTQDQVNVKAEDVSTME
ncbi:MAG: hypothetical protein DI617_09375, partial [Streptococcus pyogenes]